jgi:hypothetical protein
MNLLANHSKITVLKKDLLYLLYRLKTDSYSVGSQLRIGLNKKLVPIAIKKIHKAGYFHLIAVKNSLSKLKNKLYSTSGTA